LRPFIPLFRNPHLLTIAGNFWKRPLDPARHPVESRLFETEAGVRVLVHSQKPAGGVRGEILLLHGLEGSSDGGYMRSLAHHALLRGYAVHRLNMRGCGGTESLCSTLYHAGLTADTREILRVFREEGRGPVFACGFSLGGNVVLKLAGELGESASDYLSGIAAVSTPVDLAECVRRLGARENRIYEWRFLSRMKKRLRERHRHQPELFSIDALDRIQSIYEFDDLLTAPAFGFGNAPNYYATQSAIRFIDRIRIPTLLVQAKDDPLVPFGIFSHPSIANNPSVELIAVEHGGHLGFLSAGRGYRFWVDEVLMDWFEKRRRTGVPCNGTSEVSYG
jgi:predicted alpha/beta-fold hydrolase